MDLVITAGCALLIFLGAIFGHVISSSSFGITNLKDALEAISYLATISAAIFAVRALNAWRRQFDHEQKFSVLKNVHLACDKLFVVRPYMRSYMRLLLSRVGGIDPSTIVNLELDEKNKLAAWHEAMTELDICLEDASLFFGGELDSIVEMKADLVRFYNSGWQAVAAAVHEVTERDVARIVGQWNQEARERIIQLRSSVLSLRKISVTG